MPRKLRIDDRAVRSANIDLAPSDELLRFSEAPPDEAFIKSHPTDPDRENSAVWWRAQAVHCGLKIGTERTKAIRNWINLHLKTQASQSSQPTPRTTELVGRIEVLKREMAKQQSVLDCAASIGNKPEVPKPTSELNEKYENENDEFIEDDANGAATEERVPVAEAPVTTSFVDEQPRTQEQANRNPLKRKADNSLPVRSYGMRRMLMV